MNKLLLGIAMLTFTFTSAQVSTESDDVVQIKKNEIAINLLDFIASGAIEIQYEHYLKNNHSAQISLTAFDNYGYWEVGNFDKNETHSIAAAYKFYMGKKDHAGVFFYPYLKYMFGTQTYENYWYYDDDLGGSEVDNYEVKMDNFSFGIGMGYKWVFSKNYTLGVDASIGRTFDQDIRDEFSEVEFKSGISFGVRF